MRDEIYNAIFRLFFEGDYFLTITVGGINFRLYNPGDDDIDDNVWNMGIIANGTVYKMGELYHEGKGPGSYAELFRGDFDIIKGFTDYICEKLSIE